MAPIPNTNEIDDVTTNANHCDVNGFKSYFFLNVY